MRITESLGRATQSHPTQGLHCESAVLSDDRSDRLRMDETLGLRVKRIETHRIETTRMLTRLVTSIVLSPAPLPTMTHEQAVQSPAVLLYDHLQPQDAEPLVRCDLPMSLMDVARGVDA